VGKMFDQDDAKDQQIKIFLSSHNILEKKHWYLEIELYGVFDGILLFSLALW
jgi:hypothetical protein